MSRVGQGLVATGGVIALIPGGQTPGLALAGLGALTWFVGVHANTGILLSLDIGSAGTLEGINSFQNTTEDMLDYFTDVFESGRDYFFGTLNDDVGTIQDLWGVGTELRNLAETFVVNTQQDFQNGTIPADGATTLPPQQSCCVVHGGCPGETGSQCALNCCCCGPGFACDPLNTTNGCVFVGP
jgi:hypothetical protein